MDLTIRVGRPCFPDLHHGFDFFLLFFLLSFFLSSYARRSSLPSLHFSLGIYAPSGEFLGVTGSDMTLGFLDNVLASLNLVKNCLPSFSFPYRTHSESHLSLAQLIQYPSHIIYFAGSWTVHHVGRCFIAENARRVSNSADAGLHGWHRR